jgi:archaellum component FlaF (FlaF/FlaG flagellin family)
MNGQGDGRAGCDIGVGKCNPERVKIVCDRSDDDTEDFAVLWTEANNIIRDPAEGNYSTKEMSTILNASRIHLSETPSITYPLTVAAATDSLMLIDFDGFLNDDRIGVVYTLAEAESGAALVMKNEKVFTNGFEADVSYSREALIGSSTLPVNVTIRNTGTSSINSAEVVINGTTIAIDGAFVGPLSEKTFTVQYPLGADFDGYIESTVNVTYDNYFKTARQMTRRGASRDLRRSSQSFNRELVAYNDIDCQIVSRHIGSEGGVNTFLVELTDRSTYGLLPSTGLLVGVHPRLGVIETITQQAQTLVTDADFHQVGNVRKAYAEVYVSGITEILDGFIYPTIVEMSTIDGDDRTFIDNARAGRNASAVTLYPSSDPTYIDALRYGRAETVHHTPVERTNGGIRLAEIKEGSDVRVFNLNGYMIYNEPKAASNTLNVPLPAAGVYIISTGDEIFKYQY